MSTELIPLAFLMFLVTYPSRALGLLTPWLDRLPRIGFEYLQLVGPAILAALAAYDLRPGGRLGRVGTAIAHRLRGTIPHG